MQGDIYPFWSVGWVGAQNVFKFQDRVKDRLGVMTYFPVQFRKIYIRKMSKYKSVRKPVYGGYVFIFVVDENTINRLSYGSGFKFSAIRNKSSLGIVKIRDDEIDRLKQLETYGSFVDVENNPKLVFSKGKILVVKSGPFEGEQAVIMENHRGQTFVWASIRNKKAKISVSFFKKIGE